MNIAIDFDNTITADPRMWEMLIREMQRRDHNVYIVTGRLKETFPEDLDPWRSLVQGVFFTEHKAKGPFMEAQGIPIHIMIDDYPDAWVHDYEGKPRTYRDAS